MQYAAFITSPIDGTRAIVKIVEVMVIMEILKMHMKYNLAYEASSLTPTTKK